jgi:hypothetical protein
MAAIALTMATDLFRMVNLSFRVVCEATILEW